MPYILTALLLKIQVSWDGTLCHSVSGSLHSGRLRCHYHHHQAAQENKLALLDPEEEGTMIAAPGTTHPATQCHIPEDLNL
jgi:hypothetical protein